MVARAHPRIVAVTPGLTSEPPAVRPFAGRSRVRAILAALGCSAAVFIAAGRYHPADSPLRPTDDNEVLETLSAGSGRDPLADETRALEAALAQRPEDLALAARVVRAHVNAAKRTGDPRRLSYAEAALGPWWSLADPPTTARVLRAVVRQSRHEFTAALADLDAALAQDPNDQQALLTRASVLTVLARYEEARQSCARLVEPLLAAGCLTSAAAVRGGGEDRDRLTALMAAPTLSLAELRWAKEVRGEAYLYAGDVRAAEADLRDAMADGDTYPRALLADLLLDEGRPREVLDLIATDEINETLLLRRAIAARRANAPDAEALRATLSRAHDDEVARGVTFHQREETRRLLELEDAPARALPIAIANFAQQREPWDARLLFAAARGAGAVDASIIEPALRWAEQSGCTWPRLR